MISRDLAKTAGIALIGLVLSGTSAMAIDAEATGAANVRSGPGTSYGVVDTLSAGELVDVVECNAANTWCRIFHTGPDGWVSRSLLGAPGGTASNGAPIEFGVTIPLPGGGSITFGTPGYSQPSPPQPPGPKQVCVYDFANYAGAQACVYAGMSQTDIQPPWNDRVTSIRVFGGAHIRLCQDANFGGFCNVFSSDVPKLGVPLNNKASSYQVW